MVDCTHHKGGNMNKCVHHIIIDSENFGRCKYCPHTQQYLSYMQMTYIIHAAEIISAGVEDNIELEQTIVRDRVQRLAAKILKKKST